MTNFPISPFISSGSYMTGPIGEWMMMDSLHSDAESMFMSWHKHVYLVVAQSQCDLLTHWPQVDFNLILGK